MTTPRTDAPGAPSVNLPHPEDPGETLTHQATFTPARVLASAPVQPDETLPTWLPGEDMLDGFVPLEDGIPEVTPCLEPLEALDRVPPDEPARELAAAPVEAAEPIDPPLSALSLFAGCGGMDLGFLGGFSYKDEVYPALPYTILAAYDWDARCVQTYQDNIGDHVHQADLTELTPDQMPRAEVLIGGFPCQSFSSCGPREGLTSTRGQMYQAFVNYMNTHHPALVVAENVINLARMDQGAVLRVILADLEAAGPGYRFTTWTIFAPDYGIPQRRERVFLVGTRADLPLPPPPPAMRFTFEGQYRSIQWAIGDLEAIDPGTVPNQGQFFLAAPANAGHGQGDEVSVADRPAYTVRSNAKSRVQFHYTLPRRLTVRELARIQTFPDDFVFPHSATTNTWQIGNAVPPVLAHLVAEYLLDYFAALPAGWRQACHPACDLHPDAVDADQPQAPCDEVPIGLVDGNPVLVDHQHQVEGRVTDGR